MLFSVAEQVETLYSTCLSFLEELVEGWSFRNVYMFWKDVILPQIFSDVFFSASGSQMVTYIDVKKLYYIFSYFRFIAAYNPQTSKLLYL